MASAAHPRLPPPPPPPPPPPAPPTPVPVPAPAPAVGPAGTSGAIAHRTTGRFVATGGVPAGGITGSAATGAVPAHRAKNAGRRTITPTHRADTATSRTTRPLSRRAGGRGCLRHHLGRSHRGLQGALVNKYPSQGGG